mgnify:CR=1 FL=1
MTPFKKYAGLFLTLSLGLLSALALAQSKNVIKEIEERLEPVGSVCMAGEDCAGAAATTASAGDSAGPRDAAQIYSSGCAACHDAGVSGAPVFGDADAWAARLDQKGKDTLYSHAINGFNAMPAKGMCSDCSDEEIEITVDYMLAESQ